MTPTATYIAEENCLQEESQMEKPVELNFYIESVYTGEPSFNDEAYEKALAAYNAHVATLRKIPCSPEPGFKGGEKYTEGVDYEIKGADEWKWCYQLKGNIFAAPIVSVKGEDELWEEAFLMLRKRGYNPAEVELILIELKKSYSLTKR